MSRARLRRLKVSGADKQDAAIEFGPGLTFVTGLSNTGKSYILECLNYALAASDPPRAIPEAEGYDRVDLEMEMDDKPWTISRRLRGGDDAIVFNGTLAEWDGVAGDVIKVKIAPTDPTGTLSGKLLEASGFDPATPVIRNQRGQTQALSFRGVVPFVLVTEEEVIKTESPVLPRESVQETVAKSVFRILMTGDAPSSEQIDALQSAHKQREHAKEEASVLDRLIEELKSEIDAAGTDRGTLERELARIDTELAEVSEVVSESGRTVRNLIKQRNEALEAADSARSSARKSQDLADRFELLSQHYKADVQRLEFVLEGGHFFNQLDATHCPYCGRALDDGFECHPESADFAKVERASRAEIKKLAPRMTDLEKAVEDAAAGMAAAEAVAQARSAEAETLDKQIREVASPASSQARNRVQTIASRRNEIESNLLPYRQLDRYSEAFQTATVAASQAADRYRPGYDADAVQSLIAQVRSLLEQWRFPFTDLYFDPNADDLVIDAKPRGANGKGVRAVTHAAFTIGLMRHCLEAETPHPGFVVVDTPLRHFKGLQDEIEDPQLTRDLHAACLHSLALAAGEGQTVIIDNDDPPEGLDGLATVYDFAGAGDGERAGFYP